MPEKRWDVAVEDFAKDRPFPGRLIKAGERFGELRSCPSLRRSRGNPSRERLDIGRQRRAPGGREPITRDDNGDERGCRAGHETSRKKSIAVN